MTHSSIKLFASVFITCMYLAGCSPSSNVEQPTITELNSLLKANTHVCVPALLKTGNKLISHKNHKLKIDTLPHLKVNETSIEFNNPNLTISGTLVYNDRPSHVVFNAYTVQQKDQKSQACAVHYTLDYILDNACMTMREEAFKKWHLVAQFNDKTKQYQHMRKPNKKALLTSIDRNRKCLIKVQNIDIQAL